MSVPQFLSSYRRLRRIKALHPHSVTLPGGKKFEVTKAKLEAARDRMNERARLGTLATASTDHIITIDEKTGEQRHKPSKDIELLGYEAEWKYGKLEDGRDWLYCDAFIEPAKESQARKLPFTSVEYHPNDDIISNMAFTKHRPVLDVGTITPYHWERGEVNAEQPNTPLVAYSAESKTGPVVVYSTEQQTMDPLAVFGQAMKDAAEALIASAPSVEVKPGETVVVPFSASARGAAKLTPEAIELRTFKRRKTLEGIKASGKIIDIDRELADWAEVDDMAFDIHCKGAALSYSSVSSGGAKVMALGGSPGGEAGMNDAIKKAEAICPKRHMAGKSFMNFNAVYERCKTDPTWDGMTD